MNNVMSLNRNLQRKCLCCITRSYKKKYTSQSSLNYLLNVTEYWKKLNELKTINRNLLLKRLGELAPLWDIKNYCLPLSQLWPSLILANKEDQPKTNDKNKVAYSPFEDKMSKNDKVLTESFNEKSASSVSEPPKRDNSSKHSGRKEKIIISSKSIARESKLSEMTLAARTKDLLVLIDSAKSPESILKRLDDFRIHLYQYRVPAKTIATKEGAVAKLLRLRKRCADNVTRRKIRETLALLGYVDSLPNKGIRILSIDGGGIKGLVVIQMLRKLEELTGKRTYQLFDYICGVSTGSILAAGVGMPNGKNLDEAYHIYREFGTKLFSSTNLWWGVSNFLWGGAYYDTSKFEELLHDFVGESTLLQTNCQPNCAKLAAISTVMNDKCMQPFVFRNYSLPYNRISQYQGSCHYTVFQAVRASSAAPTVFQGIALDGLVHQDGGMLVNNPCAIAIHEAKLLWPNSEIQCVVSLGTGRHSLAPTAVLGNSTPVAEAGSVAWKTLFKMLLDSATDTEGVHTMLNDLLPPHVYFRFNPYLTEMASISESRPEKIAQMEEDTSLYIRKNEEKFIDAANTLGIQRTLSQKVADYFHSKGAEMADFPLYCKL